MHSEHKFVDAWLENLKFAIWLEKCDDIYKARCKPCNKELGVRISNLLKRKETKQHKSNEECLKIVTTEQEGMNRDHNCYHRNKQKF